jgi:hypothetical protein
MAAQFVGFGLAILVALRATGEDAGARGRLLARDALVAAGAAYVLLLGARSAILATGVACAAVAVLSGARGRAALRRPLLLAGAMALLLGVAALGNGQGRGWLVGVSGPLKAESLGRRLALLQQTALLVRDRPLGAGSGNFLHAFMPYQLRDERLRSETVVYGSPHNELLGALAEEGIVWCALAVYLLFRLAAEVRLRAQREGWPPMAVVVTAGAAFLAVEAAFQFPFRMAFGCLAAAALLGLAVSYAAGRDREPVVAPRRSVAWRVTGLAVVAAAAVPIVRLAASDYLAAAAQAAPIQREACELNPRNMRACLRASWLEARNLNRRRARNRLAVLLDRSPYYYPAIKLLAEESLAQGDPRAGCFHLWIYDTLFGGGSSAHEELSRTCDAALLEGFRHHATVPGYTRFPMAVPAGEQAP